MIEIQGHNQTATVIADYDIVHKYFQGNPAWGAKVLESAGEYGWRVSMAKKWGKGSRGSGIIEESSHWMVTYTNIGKKSFLAYQIEQIGNGLIRVTPLAYLERTRKRLILITLLVAFIVPVLLTPVFWKIYMAQTLRASKIYLPAFCRMLATIQVVQSVTHH